MPEKVIKNLFDEEVPISEALDEMESPSKEKVIIIRGEEIPERIYHLCVNKYLSEQYGDSDY